MEIAVNMMRELSVGYVDPVDPDKLMLGAAQGMVRDLDPYTEFIPADEMPDFELMTTGKYGGVGSLIRKRASGSSSPSPTRIHRPTALGCGSATGFWPSTARRPKDSPPSRSRRRSRATPAPRSR